MRFSIFDNSVIEGFLPRRTAILSDSIHYVKYFVLQSIVPYFDQWVLVLSRFCPLVQLRFVYAAANLGPDSRK
jgi:hypothetical protein